MYCLIYSQLDNCSLHNCTLLLLSCPRDEPACFYNCRPTNGYSDWTQHMCT
jgi:hypothetical protein